MPDISKYAMIERGATIAKGVKVGPFTYIGSNVRIESGCVIENNVTITGRTKIGERNHVFPLSVIGAPEQAGADGEVVIGPANVIREHVTIYGGTSQPTQIGSDNLIMVGCLVGAGGRIANHGIFVNNTHIGPGAKIEDYVHTSAFIVIDPGVSVGAYTFTLPYTDIDTDAPPFAMVQGSPFRVRGVNTEKLKRCGFGEDDIRSLKAVFRELYNSSDRMADPTVIERLLADKGCNPHVRRLAEALKAAQESAAGRPS